MGIIFTLIFASTFAALTLPRYVLMFALLIFVSPALSFLLWCSFTHWETETKTERHTSYFFGSSNRKLLLKQHCNVVTLLCGCCFKILFFLSSFQFCIFGKGLLYLPTDGKKKKMCRTEQISKNIRSHIQQTNDSFHCILVRFFS